MIGRFTRHLRQASSLGVARELIETLQGCYSASYFAVMSYIVIADASWQI